MNIKQLKHNIKFVYVIQDKINRLYLSYYVISNIKNALKFETKELAIHYLQTTFWRYMLKNPKRYKIIKIENEY